MSKLLFIDVEATGKDKEDRLCQVAYKCGSIIRNEFFKPPVPIKISAMAVTHITNKMVEDKPEFAISYLRDELAQLSEEGAIFIAHNAPFDLGMFAKEKLLFNRYIDTLKVSRYIDKEGNLEEHNLQYLRYFYGIEVTADAHDALGDIIVLEAVFNALLANLMTLEQLTDVEQGVERMREISRQPSLLSHIRFGKYSGKSNEEQKIANIVKTDRSYLEWLLNAKRTKPEGEEDWIYTLEHYLKK